MNIQTWELEDRLDIIGQYFDLGLVSAKYSRLVVCRRLVPWHTVRNLYRR